MRNDQRADDSSRQRPVSIDVNAGQTTVPEEPPPLLNISHPLWHLLECVDRDYTVLHELLKCIWKK